MIERQLEEYIEKQQKPSEGEGWGRIVFMG